MSPGRIRGGVTALDWLTDYLLAFVQATNNPIGFAVLGGSALIEYVFPPFPGDTITLFGAVLITAYGWNFFGVFGAVMAGSVAGAMADYYVGTYLRRRSLARDADSDAARSRQTRTIDTLIGRFERHGALYLVINRFLPGIRALFFVAAGMAGMRPLPVLFYSAISAALWNLGLIAIGSALGLEFDAMLTWVKRYNLVVWCVVGAVALTWFWRARSARLRRKSSSERDDSESR